MRKRAMNWDRWVEKYKPIKNTLQNKTPDGLKFEEEESSAPIDGYMFETYGEEVEFVEKARKKNSFTIWTVVDGDGNSEYAIPGAHFVNRLGYFICEVPFKQEDDDNGLEVKI